MYATSGIGGILTIMLIQRLLTQGDCKHALALMGVESDSCVTSALKGCTGLSCFCPQIGAKKGREKEPGRLPLNTIGRVRHSRTNLAAMPG
jgi:hypothetical protein